MELCEGAGLYQIDLLNGSKERVSEAEYWARRRGQLKLDRENAALTTAGQQPRQKKFETVKDTLRRQISSVLHRATSFEDFSDRLLQQYGIAVKESREQLSYLPAGRTKFIRAKHLGDNYDKKAVFATLNANAEHKPKVQFKQDTIGKLIDIQAKSWPRVRAPAMSVGQKVQPQSHGTNSDPLAGEKICSTRTP